MPAAVSEMIIDGPQILGLQTPDCFSTTGFFQSPNGCNPTDMLRNFYCTKKVGHYLIGKTLGEGSFAKVREGLHVITDEKVAIKVINKHKVRNDEYVMKNLYREAQIQQMIRHPNIAQLLDIMETDNNYYLVTELCVGGNLLNRVYERRHLEEHEVQKYIRQLSMAVEHLHRAGVVHRDLKIENLLLDENDNIKLIDFGLSNCAGLLGYTDPFSTQCGSPAYAAPELLNRQNYGPKVDVWSIGVNMYAMLTGTLPFTVEPFSLTLLHDRMVNKEMNPLPPYISPGAVMLLRNLLEPDPVKRPAIRQVANTPWLHDGQVPMNLSFLNRLHNKDINHVVVQHMTEKMGYKYSDVLSNINNNRACSSLATYFLLNKKMERLLKVNVEPAEKEVKPPQPLQESAYLAGGRSQARDSVLTPGLLRPVGWDCVRYHGGTVPSPSGAYLEINHFMPLMPLPDLRHHRRLEAQKLLARGPVQGGLGFSTSSRVMGVPTYSPVIGVPTSSRVMGVPTSSRVMGVPMSSRVTGVPTYSPVTGVPTISQVMGLPTSSRIMGVSTGSRVMGFSTSSRIMGVPTSSQFMGAPTHSRIMGVPTSSQFVGAPTYSRIMGVPTSSQFVGAPTRSRIMGVPTSSQFVGAPTSSRIMGVPTSSRVMGYSWNTGFQEMNSRQKPTPPWLRLTNGPLPHLTHLQRNAPTPRITPTPRPSAPTPALTNLGVQARLRLAKMDRQQDAKFPAMGIAQILRRPTPSPTFPDYRMQTLRYPGGNPGPSTDAFWENIFHPLSFMLLC